MRENTPLLFEPLSLRSAMRQFAVFSLPFSFSRLAVAIQNIGNGILISKRIPSVVSAAPVTFMVQQGFMGAVRGSLASVNAVVGNLNGQGEFQKIGAAVNQGLVLSLLMSVPITAIFFTSKYWLIAFGVNEDIALIAGDVLRAFSYGTIPTCLSIVDQNFLLSIKRTYSPIILNILSCGVAVAIGFPLAIYSLGFPGIGYGVSASGFFMFLLGRIYLYFNKKNGIFDREKYSLFCKNFDSGTTFKSLLGLSAPSSLQAISEWLPTMLIAVLTAKRDHAKDNLDAEQPSMQMLVVLNQLLLGFATTATVSTSNALGAAQAAGERGQHSNEIIWRKNARMYGYAGLLVTTLFTISPAIFFTSYPDPLVWLFSNNEQVFPLAKSMLRVSGATLLIDGARLSITGAILGRNRTQDNFFSSLTNLIISTGLVVLSGFFTQDLIGSPISFFISRMIGIFLVGTLMILWWTRKTRVANVATPSNLVEGTDLLVNSENPSNILSVSKTQDPRLFQRINTEGSDSSDADAKLEFPRF